MGSCFGIDGARSIKNNSRRYKRKSAFEGRGEAAENKRLRFAAEGKMNKEALAKLGAKIARGNRKSFLRVWVVSLFVLAVVAFALYHAFIHLANQF